ncbi:MAG: TonB-dependent receptor [Candidatus Acidiferrales bacterium]
MWLRRIGFPGFVILVMSGCLSAQSPNGIINGLVLDPTGSAIAGAEIRIANDATGVQYTGKTNGEGIYVVTNLPPGPYRLQVSKIGFKTLIKPDIILNVQDSLAINFTLPVGAASETITVTGGAPLVNTESGSVSTVIDHRLVENLPLNGRSFNALLQLTPGVVIAATSTYNQGQFSIAGQRTSGNNFLVDGVSANFGVSAQPTIGTSGGATQAFSALGGTSSLVSVEDLQEFRVETSSFAPEFGRTPGGQVILTTRSGTNDFHGGVYEYFRNDVLDANDWFANQAGQPRAAERHNDFGGFLGGPIRRDKTFVFVSYEGARLRQPSTTVVQVPSEFARTTAPPAIAPFLDAYPQPQNGTITPDVYTQPFTGNYSNPSTLNAGSIRIDHTVNARLSLFGRYNEAPSETARRNNSLSETDSTEVGTRTVTVGATMVVGPLMANSFRANYSVQTAIGLASLDSFGGAVPPSLSLLGPGLTNPASINLQFGTFDTGFYATGPQARNRSTQLNFADDFSVSRGAHQFKFGADYRAIYLDLRPSPVLQYIVSSVPNFIATSLADYGIFGFNGNPTKFLFQSTGLYGQDTWKINSRLTLVYGLRWELNPAPSGRNGTSLAAWKNVTNPAEIALAAPGSSLWSTTYTNFAPRVGVAYSLTPKGSFVVRAGWGIFYDLGTDTAGLLGASFPNSASACCPVASLPLADATPYIPAISVLPPYPVDTAGFAPNLKLPRSYQWNVALEKSFGGQQALSVTYVGQAGRDLLRQEGLVQPNANFAGVFLLTQNNARSNYNALQVQYRKPLAERLQALLNYTWSHSLDNASDDTVDATAISSTVLSAAKDYASSAFDVRQSFSAGVSYGIPMASRQGFFSILTRDWSLEGLIVARTGFPFNASVLTSTISGVYPRPNLVPGQPVWIRNPTAGGGKSLNPDAFAAPPVGVQGTEGRNDIRGFGLTELDMSVGRKFPLTDRLALQFRVDAFNFLNHPNFANPAGYIGFGPTYLESAQMLNNGLGGLNPLFQEGGPRSLQLSLKLSF